MHMKLNFIEKIQHYTVYYYYEDLGQVRNSAPTDNFC